MCKENDTLECVKNNAEKRFEKAGDGKSQKYSEAKHIFECVEQEISEKEISLIEEFSQKYDLQSFDYDKNIYSKLYLEDFLLELKYFLRTENKKGIGEKVDE